MRVSIFVLGFSLLGVVAMPVSAAKVKPETQTVVPRPKPAVPAERPEPVPPPEAKPEAKPEVPVTAPVASGEDPLACREALKAMGVNFNVPVKIEAEAPCGVDNPVQIDAVKTILGEVQLPGRPLMQCKFARVFLQWVADVAAPVSSGLEGARLAAVSTGPGFVCRGRNGDTTAKLSEHALGNAVDIDAFILDNKTRIAVKDVADKAGAHYRMLMSLRLSACGFFTTVLGPGANAAHEEHYHFDLGVHGKSGNYRICE